MELRAYSTDEYSDYSGNDGRCRIYIDDDVAYQLSDDIESALQQPLKPSLGLWISVPAVSSIGDGNVLVMIHPARGKYWARFTTDNGDDFHVDREDLHALVERRFDELEEA